MEQQRLWIAIAVAIAMIVFPFSCLAAHEYTVGGSLEWNLGVIYPTWVAGRTFAVGDKLVFTYIQGAHEVLEVNKTAYDSCLVADPLAKHTTGNDTITLNATGAHYYICGIGSHCLEGMKLAITVSAASSPGPSTSVSGANPPGSVSKASAAAPSYRMGGVLLAAGSVVLALASL